MSIKQLHPANARIARIYATHDLTRPELGEIAGVGRSRVDSWMRQPDNKNYRECPENLVRLIEFELGIRKPRFTGTQRELRKLRGDITTKGRRKK